MTAKPPEDAEFAGNRGSARCNLSHLAGIMLFCCSAGAMLAFLIAIAALLFIEHLTSQRLLDTATGTGAALRFMLHADGLVFGAVIAAMVASVGGLLRGNRVLRSSEGGELLRVTAGLLAALGLIAIMITAICLADDTTIARFASPANATGARLSSTAALWLQLYATWLASIFALLVFFRR